MHWSPPRSDPNTVKVPSEQQERHSPWSSSTSSATLQTHLTTSHSPQRTPPSVSAMGDMPALPDASSHTSSTPGNHYIGRQIVSYDTRNTGQTHQDSSSQEDSNRSTHGSDPNADFYTYNSLNSFSFGSAQPRPGPSLSQPVHPLSAAHSDDVEDNHLARPSDITPRPSVVTGYEDDTRSIRGHPAQTFRLYPQPPGILPISQRAGKERQHDGSSECAPKPRSPSDSVVSLPRSIAEPPRSGSSTAGDAAVHGSPYDDDEHQHPFDLRYGTRSSAVGSSGTGTGESTAVEFSSDEEYDSDYDSYYDSYGENADGLDIEVSSARFEGSVLTHDLDHDPYAFAGSGRESVRPWASPHNSERRGSLPMAIPGAIPPSDLGDPSLFASGRNREDSVATLRRPSRSLNDELRKLRHGSDGASKDPFGNEFTNRSAAPTSVPESDSDWRHLEERSRGGGAISSPALSNGAPISVPGNAASPDFGLDLGGVRGITEIDPSDLAGIIQSRNTAQPLNPTIRRPSVFQTRWLSILGGSGRRPSTATVSSTDGDTFGRAVRGWEGDHYREQQKDWSFKRERADRNEYPLPGIDEGNHRMNSNTDLSTHRISMTTESSAMALSVTDEDSIRVEKDRSTKTTHVWKGMQVDTHEIWKNDLVGRFIVNRRATKPADQSKSPQQRLAIQHFRDAFTSDHVTHNGPPVTIHKHSKAVAFSISRHYRPPPMAHHSRDVSFVGGPHRSSRGARRTEVAKRSLNMILLAPRRVQEAYTNTNSTRKLRTYNLLDDKHSRKAHDKSKRRHEGEGRERDGKERRGKDRDAPKDRDFRKTHVDPMDKGKERQQTRDDGHVAAKVSGNASNPIPPLIPPPPASAPPPQTRVPVSPNLSAGGETVSGDQASSRSSSRLSRRRLRNHPHDDYDDEEKIIAPTRTPHSETYGTQDASLIEKRQDLPVIGPGSGRSFLGRLLRGRGTNTPSGAIPGQSDLPYIPPWVILTPRNTQEQQQRAVDDLNNSFKDVGLIPSTNKDRPNQKPKKIASGSNSSYDIFDKIPSDSLYMLLPLWPGETSPSEDKLETFDMPTISSERRQYLLVYYKPLSEADNEEQSRSPESRKRSRNSPTSSYETKKEDRASILLSSFRISARPILYRDLEGTGVRVPDEGLTVTGPLDVAFQTMPPISEEKGLFEWVLGVCQSRDSGIQFYPDGMLKLGLCIPTSETIMDPRPVSEEYEPPEPDLELTPIGRAVMEMAWLGALALTSFGANV